LLPTTELAPGKPRKAITAAMAPRRAASCQTARQSKRVRNRRYDRRAGRNRCPEPTAVRSTGQ